MSAFLFSVEEIHSRKVFVSLLTEVRPCC
jgi:hypothetical protein